MGSLERRISDLEAAAGGAGECPRCSGTVITTVNGAIHAVTKYGHPFPQGAAEAFAAEEEPEGRCPLCGTLRRTFGAGWSKQEPDQS